MKNILAKVKRVVNKSSYKNQIIKDWENAPYYDLVDGEPGVFWDESGDFFRCFKELDLTHMLELACGHGRHSLYVLNNFDVGQITLVDVNQTNIDFCKERFGQFSNVKCLVNNGMDLTSVADNSITSIICYDAMVHFEYDDVANYLFEFGRILEKGGKALVHHSNNDKQPGNLYSENTHWRNFMSQNLFHHMAKRANLKVLDQRLLDWGSDKKLDCITLLQK